MDLPACSSVALKATERQASLASAFSSDEHRQQDMVCSCTHTHLARVRAKAPTSCLYLGYFHGCKRSQKTESDGYVHCLSFPCLPACLHVPILPCPTLFSFLSLQAETKQRAAENRRDFVEWISSEQTLERKALDSTQDWSHKFIVNRFLYAHAQSIENHARAYGTVCINGLIEVIVRE